MMFLMATDHQVLSKAAPEDPQGFPRPAGKRRQGINRPQFFPVACRTLRAVSNSPCMNAAASFEGT